MKGTFKKLAEGALHGSTFSEAAEGRRTRGEGAGMGHGGSGDTPPGRGPRERASAACAGPGSKRRGDTFTLNQHPSLTPAQSESFQAGVLEPEKPQIKEPAHWGSRKGAS